MSRSPALRILLGLAAILLITGAFSWYSLRQIEGLRKLQTETIDRNRRSSLQLIRIQNNLNSLALAMRDMLEGEGGYPLSAWRGEFQRLRTDLADALTIEGKLAKRPAEQQQYLERLQGQLATSSNEMFAAAESGNEQRARALISNSLTAQQAALAATVARLLVQNNEAEELAAVTIASIYDRVERNFYVFLAVALLSIAAIGTAIALHERRVFAAIADLSEQRSTLTKRMFGVQEEVLKSVSRELHDQFGQILTAVGVMVGRADVQEIREIIQDALQRTRDLSQALHPTVLEHYGFSQAVERFVPLFEKQTGLRVTLATEGDGVVPDDKAIHVYRVLQEALTNAAKHSKAEEVDVRLRYGGGNLTMKVEDHGVGINGNAGRGLGMIAMRERAGLVGGTLEVRSRKSGGTIVELRVPLETL